MPTSTSKDHDKTETGADLFTRLCVSSCEGDVGVRPLDCPKWWDSPAIFFQPDPPLPVAQQAIVQASIHNFGTMDATNVLVEGAYNLWFGNETPGNVPIGTTVVPLIPSGGTVVASLPWTPPDEDTTHACVHVRVMDDYSLINHTERSLSWDARINPQAANKNTSLVRVENAQDPIVVTYRAKNWSRRQMSARALVTLYNPMLRERDVDERYPLPFVLDRVSMFRAARTPTAVSATVGAALPSTPAQPATTRVATLRRRRAGLMTAAGTTGFWPRDTVNPRFIHNRFGFDIDGALPFGNSRDLATRTVPLAAIAGVNIKSLMETRLAPDEEKTIRVVIQPDQFPPRGRGRVFEVNYQTENNIPTTHYIYLRH